ncbi:hypothetical protein [Crateriforma conspicua]|uniref:hypothetical protein n=1 Tax=Crateriforma TaxID=2714592 RepID=UPI0011B75A26|nr:hypothetical protein [Crateriforma conspicua]
MDDINKNLSANIFGDVACDGLHAYVVVELEYFTRLDTDSRRLILTTIRDEWRDEFDGERITFKTWDGSIIAEM